MRKEQENRFTMIKTVTTYLTERQEIVSANRELAESQTVLEEIYEDLKKKDKLKKNSYRGKASTKLTFKESLIKSSMSVSAGLFAYAKKTGNVLISELTDIPKSSLEHMRDTMLVEAMEGLKNLASPVISELATYGIKQEKLDAFSEKIAQYDQPIVSSETGRVKRKGAVKSLKLLFKEADDPFGIMDKLVNGMEEKDKQEFVRGYNDSRKFQNLGVRHRPAENPSQALTVVEKK